MIVLLADFKPNVLVSQAIVHHGLQFLSHNKFDDQVFLKYDETRLCLLTSLISRRKYTIFFFTYTLMETTHCLQSYKRRISVMSQTQFEIFGVLMTNE